MKFSEVLKIAYKSIASNKTRSLLTMLGVIIGVAAVIVMMSVSAGTEATISEAINGLGSNLLFISSSMSRGAPGGGGAQGGLVYDDVFAIRDEINGIAGVSVEQGSSQTIKFGDVILEDISIVGTTPDYTTVRDIEIAEGRFINDNELDRTQKVAVLGSSLAEELFGDQYAIGEKITVGSTKLTVVGIMEEKGLVSGVNYDEQLYVPITVVFQQFLPSQMSKMMGDRVRMIYVSVDENSDMDEVIFQVELLLSKLHEVSIEEADFVVQTQGDIIETQESTTESFRVLLGWVAGVSLIVGGIGIMNIMLVSVSERTREIGLRQSVGAKPADIRMQFLTEALLLSITGGIIGIFVGVGGSYLFGEFGGMRTVIMSESILLSFFSAAAVGIFFGYVPANKAAQLDPIEALRHI
ncbi:MAG: ABC transporter permease [Anaerolineaceae bacterium]|nr:ABC transporter permease [Anaerolineaceae bacterium]